MAVHDTAALSSAMGETSARQDIWMWLYLQFFEDARFAPETCNGHTMKAVISGYVSDRPEHAESTLKEAKDLSMLPDDLLSWITDDDRQLAYLLPLVKGETGANLDMYVRLTGRALLIAHLDIWETDLLSKARQLSRMEATWKRQQGTDKYFEWFQDKKDGQARCLYAREWIEKNARDVAWRSVDIIQDFEGLLMFFDRSELRDREIKDITQSIKRSWHGKKTASMRVDKKQFNFVLPLETVANLDTLAKANRMKRAEMLQALIEHETAKGTIFGNKLVPKF